jgi:probable phosphoglycerate mutase
MATDHLSYKAYLETCIAWGSGDRDRRMRGASDGHAFFNRFDSSIAQLSGLRSAAVFSHGAAMRVWVRASARNFEASGFDMTDLDNTGMAVLEGSLADGWDLITWQGTPLGGGVLVDESAEDPTGTGVEEALA